MRKKAFGVAWSLLPGDRGGPANHRREVTVAVRLLVALLRDDVVVDSDPRVVNTEILLAALIHHRVAASVAPVRAQFRWLPVEIYEAGAAARREQALRALRTTADLPFLTSVLADAGMPWAVVKGPAASALYPEPVQRQYQDLDVIVPRRRMAAALEALQAAGGRLVDRNWPLIEQRMSGELTVLLPRGTVLDLHWTLVNDRARRASWRVPTEELLERSSVVEVAGMRFPALDLEDQLVHLALHAFISGGRRLSWLKDLERAAYANPDWERVVERSYRWGVQPAVGTMLERAARVLAAPVPVEATRRMTGRWRHVVAATDWLLPPEFDHVTHGSHTGTEVLWASRSTFSRSLGSLARGTVRSSHSWAESDGSNPLHRDVADEGARARWVAALQGDAEP